MLYIYPLFGLIVFFISFDSFFQFNFVSDEESPNDLTLLTYNTQGFMSEKEDQKIVDFISDNKVDVILFQEFSATKYKLFIKDYPYWEKTNILAPYKSVLAVFSKYPIVNKDVIEFPNSHNNAVYVDILYNNEELRIYNLHLESFKVEVSSDFDENKSKNIYKNIIRTQKKQSEQIQILLDHMVGFKGKTIVCGDFNSTQYATTYRSLKKKRKDTFIEKGSGLGATYSILGYPLRLDFILADEDFEVLSHENFKLGYSDHEPVLTTLKLN